ncbi:MAG TPA: hypothetical protein VK058_05975 [Paenalcaligenes sp.]|nr:hypothetical protein [Paenalcaligenes sp.]
MRIVLFIVGTLAVIYLMVKGFKQVLEESRAHRQVDDEQSHQQLPHQKPRNPSDEDES